MPVKTPSWTPGPRRADGRVIRARDGEPISLVERLSLSTETWAEELANAKLIAAAPELVTALAQLLEIAETYGPIPEDPALELARAALATAKG